MTTTGVQEEMINKPRNNGTYENNDSNCKYATAIAVACNRSGLVMDQMSNSIGMMTVKLQ